jgi:hypothetical protein
MKKNDFFYNNNLVNSNLSELHSCLKIFHHFNIDGENLLKYAWKHQREVAERSYSMQEISDLGKEIAANFGKYFKIIAR